MRREKEEWQHVVARIVHADAVWIRDINSSGLVAQLAVSRLGVKQS